MFSLKYEICIYVNAIGYRVYTYVYENINKSKRFVFQPRIKKMVLCFINFWPFFLNVQTFKHCRTILIFFFCNKKYFNRYFGIFV